MCIGEALSKALALCPATGVESLAGKAHRKPGVDTTTHAASLPDHEAESLPDITIALPGSSSWRWCRWSRRAA